MQHQSPKQTLPPAAEHSAEQGSSAAMAVATETIDAEVVEVKEVTSVAGSFGNASSLSGLQRAARWPAIVVRALASAWEWCFGLVSMVLVLAVLATIPVVQLVSLGYLLESSARVARSGRLRDGFLDIRKFAQVGSAVLGTFLVTRPLWLAIDYWQSARLIDPAGQTALRIGLGTLVLSLLTIAYVAWAWFRGGRLRHFLWPAPLRLVKEIRRGSMFSRAADQLWEFAAGLGAWHYLSLGFRGFVGALAWLAIPAGILALGHSGNNEGLAALASVAGIFLMAAVLLYLPFLQTHMAAENRLRAVFAWKEIRGQFRRAPLCYWFALFVTLLFALPLFLLKIEATPREATWLASLVFVVSIYPARLLTGWAVGRARRRSRNGHWIFRWGARLAGLPVVLFFALIVFLTPSLLWYGRFSLFEQHAFLVPAPFLGL